MRPVISNSGGPLERLHWFSEASWYDKRSDFLVYDVTQSPMGGFYWCGVSDRTAAATFGAPAEIAQVGPYTVLIWNKNIAPALK